MSGTISTNSYTYTKEVPSAADQRRTDQSRNKDNSFKDVMTNTAPKEEPVQNLSAADNGEKTSEADKVTESESGKDKVLVTENESVNKQDKDMADNTVKDNADSSVPDEKEVSESADISKLALLMNAFMPVTETGSQLENILSTLEVPALVSGQGSDGSQTTVNTGQWAKESLNTAMTSEVQTAITQEAASKILVTEQVETGLKEALQETLTETPGSGFQVQNEKSLKEKPVVYGSQAAVPGDAKSEAEPKLNSNSSQLLPNKAEQPDSGTLQRSSDPANGSQSVRDMLSKTKMTADGEVFMVQEAKTGTEQKEDPAKVDTSNIQPEKQVHKADDIEVIKIKVGDGVKENSEQFAEKLAENILTKTNAASKEFVVQLEPENLGKILIKIALNADSASVSMVCSNPKTLSLLSENARNIGSIIESNLKNPVTVQVQQEQSGKEQQHESFDGRGQNSHYDGNSQNHENNNQAKAQDFVNQMRLGLIGNETEEDT